MQILDTYRWNPDGERIAAVVYNSSEYIIYIWNTDSESTETLSGCNSNIEGLAWSPDGNLLAVAYSTDPPNGVAEHVIRVWDVETREIIGIAEGHQQEILSLAWNPNGSQLASSSWDGTIRIWDIEPPEEE